MLRARSRGPSRIAPNAAAPDLTAGAISLAVITVDLVALICFARAVGGALTGVALCVPGGVRPPALEVQRWMGGPQPAWTSPPLLSAPPPSPR